MASEKSWKSVDDILEVVLVCKKCGTRLGYNRKSKPDVPPWCQSPGCTKPTEKKHLAPGSPEMEPFDRTEAFIDRIFALQRAIRTAKNMPFEIRLEFTDRHDGKTSEPRRGK